MITRREIQAVTVAGSTTAASPVLAQSADAVMPPAGSIAGTDAIQQQVADTLALQSPPAANGGWLQSMDVSELIASAPQDGRALTVTDDPSVIFGPHSQQVEPLAIVPDPIDETFFGMQERFLTDSVAFSAIVLFCFVSYCLLVYLYRSQVGVLSGLFRSKLYVERLLDGHNRLFEVFLRLIITLGLIAMGVAMVKYVDIFTARNFTLLLPPWMAGVLSIAFSLVFTTVWGVQYAVLKTAGSLTRSQAFVARLINLRKLVFALATIILMPVLFVLATGHETATQVATAIMIMGASVLVIFLLRRTYMLFIEQKISILYWILYLCGVEIFPVSFLILLVVKNL